MCTNSTKAEAQIVIVGGSITIVDFDVVMIL